MKAMVLDRFGGPEVLYLADIERPRASPGNVVVQVAFAGVNPADWKAREGWLASYFQYQFPFVLGFDAAGIIAEVGEGERLVGAGVGRAHDDPPPGGGCEHLGVDVGLLLAGRGLVAGEEGQARGHVEPEFLAIAFHGVLRFD